MANSPLVEYTKLSNNNSGKRTHKIDIITPHCVVGQCTLEGLGDWFTSGQTDASSNYGIDKDGRIGMYVSEDCRSWCSSSTSNDDRAVTIECASDVVEPYKMNDKVYDSLVNLCVDICKRNGKSKLLWFGDKKTTLDYTPSDDEMLITVHRWFADKSCPGDWLYGRLGNLASEVTLILGGSTQTTAGGNVLKQGTIVLGDTRLIETLSTYNGTTASASEVAEEVRGYKDKFIVAARASGSVWGNASGIETIKKLKASHTEIKEWTIIQNLGLYDYDGDFERYKTLNNALAGICSKLVLATVPGCRGAKQVQNPGIQAFNKKQQLSRTWDGVIDLYKYADDMNVKYAGETLYSTETAKLLWDIMMGNTSYETMALHQAAAPESIFTPRLTRPGSGNKFYIREASGGYSTCVPGSPMDSKCDVLSNCVGYALGRFNEIVGSWKYTILGNAENFWDNRGTLPMGSTPKLGAIIVWQKGNTRNANGKDGCGHVGVVEQVNSDEECVISESGWESFVFRTRTITRGKGNWTTNSSYKFLGFIYNPAVSDNGIIVEDTSNVVGKPDSGIVAVTDKSIIPHGSKIFIEDKVYTAGPSEKKSVTGKNICLLMSSKDQAADWKKGYYPVYWAEGAGVITGIGSFYEESASTLEGKPPQTPFLSVCKKYLGAPYVWGGKSFEDGGFDCSGFIIAYYEELGYKWGNTRTTSEISLHGEPVEVTSKGSGLGNAIPGDLLFNGVGVGNCSHVALYLGEQYICHAPSSGEVIKIEKVRKKPCCIRRIF